MSDVTAATTDSPDVPAAPAPPDPAVVAFDQRLQSLEDRVYRLEHPVQTT